MTPLRTNRSNDGRAFQREIELTAGAYDRAKVATFRKVDPPVAVIWPFNKVTGRKEQRVIFKANPWPDFAGVWTARHGRMILIECKSSAEHRLPLNRDGGLRAEQVTALRTWRIGGAAVAVLWQHAGQVALFTPEMVREAEIRGDKSLVFEAGLPVPRGDGAVIWDFLRTLENELWPAPPGA